MMVKNLSLEVTRRIAILFPVALRAEVADLLAVECGLRLAFDDSLGVAGIERIRFAVLKLSGGSLDRLWAAVELAQQDWRDTLVAAEFAGDPQSHLDWLADR